MLRSSLRERGISMKEALNEAVRAGLTTARPKAHRRFVQKTYALGAMCVCCTICFCSCDADFDRFPSLRWRNPLR